MSNSKIHIKKDILRCGGDKGTRVEGEHARNVNYLWMALEKQHLSPLGLTE